MPASYDLQALKVVFPQVLWQAPLALPRGTAPASFETTWRLCDAVAFIHFTAHASRPTATEFARFTGPAIRSVLDQGGSVLWEPTDPRFPENAKRPYLVTARQLPNGKAFPLDHELVIRPV